MNGMTTIAFIGLGNMGGGMAANLAAKGFAVRAFDLSAEALAKAEAHQDTEKAQIERIKLEALENIRKHFVQTRGERA